jgi:ribonuclease R
VHVSSLTDDYYIFVEEQYALIGERTRRRFRTGDRVRIRVDAVDIEQRRIVFELLAAERDAVREAPAGKAGKKASGRGRKGGDRGVVRRADDSLTRLSAGGTLASALSGE